MDEWREEVVCVLSGRGIYIYIYACVGAMVKVAEMHGVTERDLTRGFVEGSWDVCILGA